MMLKNILIYIKSMFCHSKYYNEKYGWYNIVNVKFRTDYLKSDVLIVTDSGIWYKLPYFWLMNNSVDKNGNPAKINNNWV